MIVAGADVFRANFSHGSIKTHEDRINSVRDIAKKHEKVVAILIDLQGPKIRIGRFKNKKIQLQESQHFIFDTKLDSDEGTEESVSLDYKNLLHDVHPGDTLLLDDGRIVMTVETIKNTAFIASSSGGELSNNKGINRLGGGLSAKHSPIKTLSRDIMMRYFKPIILLFFRAMPMMSKPALWLVSRWRQCRHHRQNRALKRCKH